MARLGHKLLVCVCVCLKQLVAAVGMQSAGLFASWMCSDTEASVFSNPMVCGCLAGQFDCIDLFL